MLRITAISALTALALAGASTASAQTIGFKLGASFAKWDVEEDGSDLEGLETLTSFMGGGFVRIGVGQFGIQPEILVVSRGFSADDPLEEGGELETKVDYIEVPVLLVFPLRTGMGFSPYLFAGPSFAFEIDCQVETELGDVETEIECSDDDDRKSVDIGITGGLGVSVPAGPGSVFLEGRYNHGLTDLFEDDLTEVKSRTFALLAGYSIYIGRRR